MNFKLSKKTEEFLKIIVKTAQTENIRVFFVGGIVRDNCLNKETQDIDIIVEGNAIDLSKKLPETIKIKSVHKDFGTVKLEYQGLDIDLASTRIECYPYSGCLPVIEKIGVKIEDDVKRRDYTVNSLYSEITLNNNKLEYRLIDMVNGIQDIEEKTLKVLHNKSYIDDPTRILRGLNFKYRFGFDFSCSDKELINNFLNNINLENASIDRITDVFKKTLNSDFQDEIFKEIIKNKYYRILFNNDTEVDFEKLKSTITKFQLNKEQKAKLYFDIISKAPFNNEKYSNPIDEYKYYSKLDLSKKALLYYNTGNENIINYSNIKITLTGKDLLEYNYPKGIIIGKILDELLSKKLENPELFPDLDSEIKWVLYNYPKI